MKVKVEIDLTPVEFKELFVPGEKHEEFMYKTYDAYVDALTNQVWMDQLDPYNYLRKRNEKRSNSDD